MKIFALLLLFPFPALAAPLLVQGVLVEAENIEFYAGTQNAATFDLVHPVTLPFRRENLVPLIGHIYLHRTGTVSMNVSTEPKLLSWQAPDGKIVTLDCGAKQGPSGEPRGRPVQFHANGEYRGGCTATTNVEFSTAYGNLTVAGNLEVDDQFRLIYGGNLRAGTLLLGNETVTPKTGTEIYFYRDGKLRFFTLAAGQGFTSAQGEYGTLTFTQPANYAVSTSLFADGRVEKGIVGQALEHKQMNFMIPIGAGIGFGVQNGELRLSEVIWPAPAPVNADGYHLLAQRFLWDLEKDERQFVTAAPFQFKNPEGEQWATVPANSLVVLNTNGKIIRIQVLRPR